MNQKDLGTKTPAAKSETLPTRQSKLWIDCPSCDGKGFVIRAPFYANPMPENEKVICPECDGQKQFFIVPDNTRTIIRSTADALERFNKSLACPCRDEATTATTLTQTNELSTNRVTPSRRRSR